MNYSLVVPVYKNEESIALLLEAITSLHSRLGDGLEVVFVVDGSPDRSFEMLRDALPTMAYSAQLVAHSRNFGSFAAIRTGLLLARGKFFAVMAADLQEPPDLVAEFFKALELDQCDVAVGTRLRRDDPYLTRISSYAFWTVYRRLIMKEMPEGGVDIFGCNWEFRTRLLELEESRSSLIALVFWLGFRRKFFSYERRRRQGGVSSWTFAKKFDYMLDSIFSFTDYPIRLLMMVGGGGFALTVIFSVFLLIARSHGAISVPGYAATMIATFFWGTLNLLGLGLVGNYAWRGYENSKRRPSAVVALQYSNRKASNADSSDC